jgi:translocation and assembly module TamB
MRLIWVILLFSLWVPTFLWAQNASIESWLEQKLSSDSSNVQIEGLTGVLASDIHIDRIIFSDRAGQWAELTGATLSWSRAALLLGQLDITQLWADSITVSRLPQVDTPGLDRTAQPWTLPTLPKLPISVVIRSFGIEKFEWISTSGSSFNAYLAGNLHYDEAGLITDIKAQAKNGPLEKISLTAQYSAETGQITTVASYSENADGALSRALSFQNAGPISINVDGKGQFSNYVLNYNLIAQSSEPISGQLSITGDTSGTHVLASLGGDLSPLISSPVAALKRAGNMVMELDLSLLNDKRISVNNLQVASQTISARANGALDDNHWPEHIDLNVTVAPGALSEDLLKTVGVDTKFGEGQIDLSYNRSLADEWTLNAEFQNASFGAFQAERTIMKGFGKVAINPAFDENWINGTISLGATEISASPDIQPFIKDGITAGFEFDYSKRTGLGLKNITAKSEDVIILGQLTLPVDYTKISANLSIDIGKLSIMQPITKTAALRGSAQAQTDFTYHLNDGQFFLSSSLQTNELAGLHPKIDLFFADKTNLEITIERNSAGTFLRKLLMSNPQVSADGSGNITMGHSQLKGQLRLNDTQLIDPSLSGALHAKFSAEQTTKTSDWDIFGDMNADQNTAVSYSASYSRGRFTNLRIEGKTNAAMANGFLSPNSIKGPLEFDIFMPDMVDRTSMSGKMSIIDGTIAISTLPVPILNADISAQITGGRATLDGRANYGEQKSRIVTSGWADLVKLSQFDIKLKSDPISMRLQSGIEARLTSDIRFASAPDGMYLASGQIDISDLFVDLGQIVISNPDRLTVIHQGISQTHRDFLESMGLLKHLNQTKTSRFPVRLDIKLVAPNRIFVRGRGVDAEFGGSMELSGTTTAPEPLGEFRLIRGRMDLLTKRANIAQGRLVFLGTADPEISLKADVSGQDGDTLYIDITGRVSKPLLNLTSDTGRPSEEVLAQVLFGKAMDGLSPTQAILLVNALRTFGSPKPSVMERIRATSGLDDLDIDQSQNGEVAVSAGKYINDNAYIEFKIDATGTSQSRLNIDLTKRVKGFISQSITGDGQLGFTIGKDYK